MNDNRQSRREVRNPLLALPAVRDALETLNQAEREAVVSVLKAIQTDARDRANESWRKHKAPMACYWKAVGVYAGHIARAFRPAQGVLPL